MALDFTEKCPHTVNIYSELPCKYKACMSCIKDIVERAGRFDQLQCPHCSTLFALNFTPQQSMNPPQYVGESRRYDTGKFHSAGVIQNEGKIMGMSLIDDQLFVIHSKPSCIIFKYDLTTAEHASVKLSISNMKYPRGMAASETSSCLYITDWHTQFSGRLWRLKYQRGQGIKQEDPVAIFDAQPFGVSVSQKTDQVVVTCVTPYFGNGGLIYIYKPNGSDFQKIGTIDLPDLENPRHSILTPSSKLIVCHGRGGKSHGVTSYNSKDLSAGVRKLHFYGTGSGGGKAEQEMNKPVSLIQGEDGFILVVDYYNHRIHQLTEDLLFVRHLNTIGITYPRHVCLDPKTDKICVGQYDGKVQIFDALRVGN